MVFKTLIRKVELNRRRGEKIIAEHWNKTNLQFGGD